MLYTLAIELTRSTETVKFLIWAGTDCSVISEGVNLLLFKCLFFICFSHIPAEINLILSLWREGGSSLEALCIAVFCLTELILLLVPKA